MNFKLDIGAWNGVFAVPLSVVDNYIKLASGNAVKVLLCFLRHGGETLSLSEVSNKIGMSESDVEDALNFWARAGLLSNNDGRLTPNSQPQVSDLNRADTSPTTPTSYNSPNSSLKKVELDLTREPQFMPKEIVAAIMSDAKIDYLFKECERLFGRPLKPIERQMLMVIIEDAGLAVECTLMLVEHCCSIGKGTPAYIKKVALSWVEKEINNVTAAEYEIKAMKAYLSVENELKRLFEINSALSKTQKGYITKWTGTFDFSLEMIDAAYQRTLDNTGKAAFPYMDKILSDWREKGYTCLEDLQKIKKPKLDEKTSSFDVDEIYMAELQKYKK
ncbi:MAG: DnaD domain protein [Oscillospiraceae bacterium]|nr:DnaD domain protein [Oscillospiraceae bacterium]